MDTEITGQTSDGYHTFDELYEHRNLLFIAMLKVQPSLSWYAEKHSDGSRYEGWFIAGFDLPGVGDITYHLPVRLMPLFEGKGIKFMVCAPPWDGHKSSDVLEMLEEWIKRP